MFRFTTSVFPSEEDDVVTSPYNALLALGCLVEHADCVLPVENQALIDIVNRHEAARERAAGGACAGEHLRQLLRRCVSQTLRFVVMVHN